MELAYVVGIRCCTMGHEGIFCPKTGTQSGLKHATNGHDFYGKPPHLLVALSRRPLPRPLAPPARPLRGPCSWGWRSVEVPRGISQNGGLMTVTIWLIIFFRIFQQKIGGDLRGKTWRIEGSLNGIFADWIWLGSKKMIGIGNGIWPRKPKKDKGSQRDLEDFRGNFE